MAPATKKQGKGATPPPASAARRGVSKKLPKSERTAAARKRQAAAQAAARENRPGVALTQAVGRHGEVIKPDAIGRPAFPYTQELEDQLFLLISTGSTLDEIGEMEGMPCAGTLVRWIGTQTHPFSSVYPRAKALLVPLFEERAWSVALRPQDAVIRTTREVLDREGNVVSTEEVRSADNPQRAALAFEAYKWTLSHLMPKKHGRQADPDAGKPNDQLSALFDALKQGPAE